VRPSKSRVRPAALALALAGLVLPVGSASAAGAWQVKHAQVRVLCPMTVGGSFEAKTGALTGSVTLAARRPPAFAGVLSVDLRTLNTGIDLRDEHLREKYLETTKGTDFERARLSDIHLGDVDPETFVGRTTFGGTFQLHGVTRPVTGTVAIRRDGDAVQLEAAFPVSIPDFGIPTPRYLGVGVADQVQVKVTLLAVPAPPGAETR
jgi:polyisoprenoid-binding protein YceI